MTQTRNRRAGVEDRWTKTVRRALPDGNSTTESVPSRLHGKGLRWRARYVDDDGREHAKGFSRKADAQSWLNGVVAAQETGSYIDPASGKVTFTSFYKEWSKRQVWVSGTTHSMNLAANSVTFGNVAFADLRASHIEAWVKRMQDNGLEPTTIRTRFANVRNVMRAAVRDRGARGGSVPGWSASPTSARRARPPARGGCPRAGRPRRRRGRWRGARCRVRRPARARRGHRRCTRGGRRPATGRGSARRGAPSAAAGPRRRGTAA